MCYNIQVSYSSCGDLLDYLMACKYLSWSLLIGWSWANQGISLVDHLNLGAYELIELDKYAMLLAMRWLNGLID